jgi:hypothetical protein
MVIAMATNMATIMGIMDMRKRMKTNDTANQ